MENSFYSEFDFEHLPGTRTDSDHRTPFQVDRDRVLFSFPFRRLQSKTQVFKSGEYDFYRTRLTHTIEVARIARSIAEFLNSECQHLNRNYYIDPDLIEGIGLAHDIGHPPFGHIGERQLNLLMEPHGGFEGNAQTLRILTELIYERAASPHGMRPTRAFLDGVMKYKSLFSESFSTDDEGKPAPPKNHFLYDEQKPYRDFIFGQKVEDITSDSGISLSKFQSIECQIMDWADDTAYSLHDVSDGIQAGYFNIGSLERWGSEQKTLSSYKQQALEDLCRAIRDGFFEPRMGLKIGRYIQACRIEKNETPLTPLTHRHAWNLCVDEHVQEECALHKQLAVDLIFNSPSIQQIEYKGGHLLSCLFTAYVRHYVEKDGRVLHILPEMENRWVENTPDKLRKIRRICDYLAGMTDSRAVRAYKRFFDADFGSILELS